MKETKYYINANKTKIAISHIEYCDDTKECVNDFDFDIIEVTRSVVWHYKGYFTIDTHGDQWTELEIS